MSSETKTTRPPANVSFMPTMPMVWAVSSAFLGHHHCAVYSDITHIMMIYRVFRCPAQLAATTWKRTKAPSTQLPIPKDKSAILLSPFDSHWKLSTFRNSFFFLFFPIWQLADSFRNYFREKRRRTLWVSWQTESLWFVPQHVTRMT